MQNAEIPHYYIRSSFSMREKIVLNWQGRIHRPLVPLLNSMGVWNLTWNLNIIYANSYDRTCDTIIPVANDSVFEFGLRIYHVTRRHCVWTFMYTCPKWFLIIYFFLDIWIAPIKYECRKKIVICTKLQSTV